MAKYNQLPATCPVGRSTRAIASWTGAEVPYGHICDRPGLVQMTHVGPRVIVPSNTFISLLLKEIFKVTSKYNDCLGSFSVTYTMAVLKYSKLLNLSRREKKLEVGAE